MGSEMGFAGPVTGFNMDRRAHPHERDSNFPQSGGMASRPHRETPPPVACPGLAQPSLRLNVAHVIFGLELRRFGLLIGV